MIINGKDTPLSKSFNTLPNVSEVLPDWFQDLTFDVVTKTVVNYEIVESLTTIHTQGVRQPMAAQQLVIKPEGQRGWKWETIHCLPDVKLNVDDIIIFDGVKYRVMSRWNWAEYGYLEYEICQAYDSQEES
ncbi:MAG: hypothetical protein J6S67_25265 [Methanobrevibacter sp.]|nr:hypothetical protein [Methanobrevibacter sp.]